MSEYSALPTLGRGTAIGAADLGASLAVAETERLLSRENTSSPRVTHLVRRAIMFLENDRQRACRCLTDALALLGPEPQWRSTDDPVACGEFQQGGLARWQAGRVVSHIDTHLESRLDVCALAKLVSFSKSHFSRAFSQSLGCPPMTYVKLRRVERAKSLMTSTRRQLTDIAQICGFADQSHLNRTFRRIIGVSPGRWRRSNILPPDETSALKGGRELALKRRRLPVEHPPLARQDTAQMQGGPARERDSGGQALTSTTKVGCTGSPREALAPP